VRKTFDERFGRFFIDGVECTDGFMCCPFYRTPDHFSIAFAQDKVPCIDDRKQDVAEDLQLMDKVHEHDVAGVPCTMRLPIASKTLLAWIFNYHSFSPCWGHSGDVMDKWRRTIISSVRLDRTSAGSFPASPGSPVDTAGHHAAKQGGSGGGADLAETQTKKNLPRQVFSPANGSARLNIRGLLAFRPLGLFISYFLTFCQCLEAIHVDCRKMRKQIFSTLSRADETKTFGIVEPLHSTCCHKNFQIRIN
jgi:hypothetical protein